MHTLTCRSALVVLQLQSIQRALTRLDTALTACQDAGEPEQAEQLNNKIKELKDEQAMLCFHFETAVQ